MGGLVQQQRIGLVMPERRAGGPRHPPPDHPFYDRVVRVRGIVPSVLDRNDAGTGRYKTLQVHKKPRAPTYQATHSPGLVGRCIVKRLFFAGGALPECYVLTVSSPYADARVARKSRLMREAPDVYF